MPAPSTSHDVLAEDFASGLAGTLGVQVLDTTGAAVIARTTSGISELGSTGIYRKTITTPATPGTYFVVWDDAGTPPLTAAEELVIEAVGAQPPPPGTPGVGGPCTGWIGALDVAAFQKTPPAEDDPELAAAIDAATWVVYQRTGRRYRGACTRSVRPCRRGCSCWVQQLTATTVIGASRSSSYPGVWDTCGCGWRSVVELSGYPVRSIDAVTIDGDALDASFYRLERKRLLVRTDGQAWPACQNMSAEPGEAGSFVIAYQFGADPPTAGRLAAAQLAAELYAGITTGGEACRLPAAATEIVRQGITIRRQLMNLVSGPTGLELVDAFLGSAPSGRRPAVYSPDLAPYPRPI